MMNNLNINQPVLMDNKNLWKENIAIREHFADSEKEMDDFARKDGLIRDTTIEDEICRPVCHSVNSSQLLVK